MNNKIKSELCKYFSPYGFTKGGTCKRHRNLIKTCNAEFYGSCSDFREKPGARQHPEECRHFEKCSHTCWRKDRVVIGIKLPPPSHCSVSIGNTTHCEYFEPYEKK